MVFVSVLVDLVRATRQERANDHASAGVSLSNSSSVHHDHSPTLNGSGGDITPTGTGTASSASVTSSTIMNMAVNSFHQRGRWRDRFDTTDHMHRSAPLNSSTSIDSLSSSSPSTGNIGVSTTDSFYGTNDSGSGYNSSTSSDGHSPSRSRSPSPGAGNGHGPSGEWWIGATTADGRRRFYRVRSRSPSPDKR
ncbi:hypothetical protein BDF19DRAFT_419595 [Syncephalis fuscata]|nr:hypothetical protein BDF19DRAFT_419595 [Syncephalis fuscata]